MQVNMHTVAVIKKEAELFAIQRNISYDQNKHQL